MVTSCVSNTGATVSSIIIFPYLVIPLYFILNLYSPTSSSLTWDISLTYNNSSTSVPTPGFTYALVLIGSWSPSSTFTVNGTKSSSPGTSM